MNGVSLLLALASLNVVYSWRAGVDGQQEYILQIEPEIVQTLITRRPGDPPEEILAEIPADAGPFQRLVIMILPKDGTPTKHSAAAEDQFRQILVSASRYASRSLTPATADNSATILWPARAGAGPQQVNGVTTTWQADATGKQQYLVQIDPAVFGGLALGDELYVPVDRAAGRIARFVVSAGAETVARGGSPSATAPPAVGPPTTIPLPRSQFGNAADGSTPAWNNSPNLPPATLPLSTLPQTNLPPGYGNSPATLPPASYPPSNLPPVSGPPNYDQYRSDQFRAPPPSEPINQPRFGQAGASEPQWPSSPRPYGSQYSEPRVANLPPTTVTAGTTAPAVAPSFVPPATTFPQTTLVQPQQDKPWVPLMFVAFALFFSIGGNLYLAYTALEFHSRYRNAIERLRSAARSP